MLAAARLGNGEAHAALGNVFYHGLGVEANCPSSRIYLISAARKSKLNRFIYIYIDLILVL